MNCRNPAQLVDESVHVVDFKEPGTMGAYVTLVCTSGLTLMGPNTSTCMGNGEWEPDPRDAECINTSTTVHVTTPSVFEALGLDGKIAVASSVTVFVIASIIFFSVGFLCGHFCQKKRKPSTSVHVGHGESVPPIATGGQQTQMLCDYDDVVLRPHDIVQELELKDNVAYGPVR